MAGFQESQGFDAGQVGVSKREASASCEQYHASLLLDPWAARRRDAAQLRSKAHARLLQSSVAAATVVDGAVPTWATLEQQLESEVAVLRSFLGCSPLWSPGLCERLRAIVQSHGLLPFLGRRGWDAATGTPAELIGDSPVNHDTLNMLFGGRRRGCRHSPDEHQAHAWLYSFTEPTTALAHLVSHPGFGVGFATDAVPATEPRAAVIVGSFTSLQSGGGRQLSPGRASGPLLSNGKFRFAIVLLSWQGPPRTDEAPTVKEYPYTCSSPPPVGPDLAMMVDLARTHACKYTMHPAAQHCKAAERVLRAADALCAAAGYGSSLGTRCKDSDLSDLGKSDVAKFQILLDALLDEAESLRS
ncbi:unnamed protein product [Polarella glacialis]|uniref:Uncharacterized protein n=1 Tax=Polarella glacialis TaxID=89957 RepID=A0A813JZ50_POLGL|nr:unnamed protein product [Polarella glacialis]